MPHLWIVASLLSNFAIIGVEYLNRTSPSLLTSWSRAWPLIFLGQLCLWYSYRHAPALFTAWIVFTIGNSLVRILMAATLLDEPLRLPWIVAAATAMIVGSYCIKQAIG